MQQTPSSADIARQTLIQLAKHSHPPTPDNFTRVYNEIAGINHRSEEAVAPILQTVLAEIAAKPSGTQTLAQSASQAMDAQQWPLLKTQLQQLLSQDPSKLAAPLAWSGLIRDLLKQLETSHKGITLSRKKEGLHRVLTNFGKDPSVLYEKIQALCRAWKSEPSLQSQAEASSVNLTAPAIAIADPASALPVTGTNSVASQTIWCEMLHKTIRLALIPALGTATDPSNKGQQLLAELKADADDATLLQSAERLKSVLLAVEIQRDTQAKTQQALLDLLRLLTTHLEEWIAEDQWLKGHKLIINDLLAQPVTLPVLYDAQSSLKQLLLQQASIKPALQEAKDLLTRMAGIFMSRLVEMTEDTSDYHAKIQSHQQKLTHITDINELNHVLADILDDTKHIGINVQRARDAFDESQQKVLQAEQKIQDLTAVLDRIAEVANQDYLTGTLNRRGMDEALVREMNRADRHHSTLSIAMMDIDHFKQLNDKFGHVTGDEALTHFAAIFTQLKRSTDVIARYGGEEFMIILPDTTQDQAIGVIQRVQRDLTKNFFMHNNDRIVITFSAGVAERQALEPVASIIARADAALYQAKQTGRNRVVGAMTEI